MRRRQSSTRATNAKQRTLATSTRATNAKQRTRATSTRATSTRATSTPPSTRATNDTLVYIGPTLPADEVRAALPGATVMPPAAVGDILRATRMRGVRRIAIVDGYFERMAAVWHKEILVALERGIVVYGAASMGALRAAELARFGMIGVGSIFRDYARGVLVADDEVAVAHLPAEYGYRAVSDALVNIRYGLAQAAKARVIAASDVPRLVELARARFYRERTWAQLVQDARDGGLGARPLDAVAAGPLDAVAARQLDAVGAHQLDALAAWRKPDRKALDARMLLRRLRAERSARPGRIRVPRTWALRQLESLML